ncbi:MAG: hypothetical protein JXR95_03445 [Deltaproteobacteria bacterium]|nr:hypothetical protein [Deltaproteobacteria bacterium]
MDSQQFRVFHDSEDFQLLETINLILDNGKTPKRLKKLFDTGFHPRGIKELAAPQSLRIAVAMMELLGTLKKGTPEERLHALRAVRTETLHESSQSLRNNVARVLMRIMKRIVRSRGNLPRQLSLIHDFREAATGKPRLVRKYLKKYHLFEMPEEWNQLAFDHHVHDANSKGRKSPTHMVMDAWIKGIRFLGVIYYNFIRPEVASELLEAAEIMGIEVRLGVELAAKMHNRYVQLVWSPMGFFDRRDFVDFLNEPEVAEFMKLGVEVREFKTVQVLHILENYNKTHRHVLSEEYEIKTDDLTSEQFMNFVGRGQPSLVHLAEFVHKSIFSSIRDTASRLFSSLQDGNADPDIIRGKIDKLDRLIPEKLVELYFRPEINPGCVNCSVPVDTPEIPTLMNFTVEGLLDILDSLPCRSRITLNPSNLTQADVIEALYRGHGRITHIEIYNSKDWAHHLTEHREAINNIRIVINNQNVIELKRIVRERKDAAAIRDSHEGTDQESVLEEILGNLSSLLGYYQHQRLRSRMGSDSIGRSRTTPGMGMVVLPTIPWRGRREILKERERLLPISTTPVKHTSVVVGNRDALRRYDISMQAEMKNSLSRIKHRITSWSFGSNTTTLSRDGNIAAIGGLAGQGINGLKNMEKKKDSRTDYPKPLNSTLKNFLKIFVGFIPAFITFYFTKSWWVLAWFGALIWFGITGFRNIIQSVLGGGGLFRTSLLEWKDFVNWSRVSDSLLFTGFSVPLLDFLVKDLLLNRSFGITPSSDSLTLYTVMALANGIYISSHNMFRGLPIGAVVGNFFRTVLSIPVAIFLNFSIILILKGSGASGEVISTQMFLWAAVISKFASDIVAAIIEGSADRKTNVSIRLSDYREKLQHIYKAYSRLEVVFPSRNVNKLMTDPEKLSEILMKKDPVLLKNMVINSLDLLYFWMYQPRAEYAFRKKLKNMNENELVSLIGFLNILRCKKMISSMILDGLTGKKFEKPLAFFLSRSDEFLSDAETIIKSNIYIKNKS